MPASESTHLRLRKHAEYQRVYKKGRKQFSRQMSYFYALRAFENATGAAPGPQAREVERVGPRVGLTVGKVLGKAVDRNRIKRRMREAVRKHIGHITFPVDIILHPRKSVKEMKFPELEREVGQVFAAIQSTLQKQPAAPAKARQRDADLSRTTMQP